jgi:uncharacterized protein YjdB
MKYSHINTHAIVRIMALLVLSACVEQVTPVKESAFLVTSQLDIVSGNTQVGEPGKMLPAPLVVRVTNSSGTPVSGHIVNFRVTSGGGKVFAGAAISDANGLAKERWTLGTNVGAAQRVEARAVDANGNPVVYATFTATFGTPTEPPAPVATVSVTPSADTVNVGATTQLTATLRDSNGDVLTGRAISWTSRNSAVATVSSSGLVTGTSAGVTGVIATSETKADTATITVQTAAPPPPPPPPASGVADPTQLPAANGARPVTGSYGRNIAAGQTYVDPNTNVTVLKVTDASTPSANSGMDRGYSEGGPHISQPWTGTDGQTYYTLKVADRLVDLRYGTLTLTNWRNVVARGEVDFAFSLNPSTPRIGYTIEDADAKRVSRYNTATNQIENTGNWPWIASAGGTSFEWLQNSLNDKWFVGMLNSNHTVVAFRPSDGFQRAFTESGTGLSIDEPHIDRELPYVYLSTNGDDSKQNVVGFLETGATRVPANASWQSDDHAAPLRGMIAGVGHWQRNTNYYYDVLANQTVEFTNSSNTIGYPGDYHTAGQWVFNNGTGPGQWLVYDAWGSDYSAAAIRVGMIGIVRMSPFSARLIAAHDSQPSSYESQPQTTISPDGKIVMWTSNMGGKTRTDVFLARMPVR